MILLPSRRITKPQSGGSVDLQRAHDSGTLYLSFADAGFTDRIGGGVVRNPGGLALGPNGKITTFNGAQQVNSQLWLGNSHTGLIVAARILATGAQAGTPGAAFGVYDSASQGGFGVGFDPSGNAGAALLTSGGAYLNARSPVGLNKWVTVFAQISGGNAGFSVAYVDGQPATVGQAGSYAGDPRVPREIAYGAQHRSSGFLRQFKGDVEWAAILRVAPVVDEWRSLTDSLALDLYESGYPYNLIKTTRRVYFDMGAGGGGTTHTVTAAPVEQGSTTTRPGLTQTHVTTARAVAQGSTVGRPAVTQTHVVTARAVAQGSTVNAPTVEVGSITVVTARPVVQSSTVNAPSIVQTHIVTARPAAQGSTVGAPSIVQTHAVTARPSAHSSTVTRPGLNQTHTVTARAVAQSSVVNAPSVDVGSTPATFVTARPVAQGSTVNAPGIRQTHVTSAREVVQGSTISAPGLVQTHVVTARAVVQAGSVNKPWVTTGSGTFTGLSPADLAAIRAAVRAELHAELTAIFQIQTKVDAAL